VGLLGVVAAAAVAGGGHGNIREFLTGYEEDPAAISTTGFGDFKAKVKGDKIEYRLSYGGLEGDITQSHVHFGNKNASGGICFFLCQRGQANAPAGTPECPAGTTGMVSGEVDASDVIGPEGQGIEKEAFEEAVRAIRAGRTYANVHSTKWTGGEIRAQIDD
jgi:hypothetical protein